MLLFPLHYIVSRSKHLFEIFLLYILCPLSWLEGLYMFLLSFVPPCHSSYCRSSTFPSCSTCHLLEGIPSFYNPWSPGLPQHSHCHHSEVLAWYKFCSWILTPAHMFENSIPICSRGSKLHQLHNPPRYKVLAPQCYEDTPSPSFLPFELPLSF